ncbi:hypothetical protein VCRA2113O415_60056 [Vibrio crassostreae]|nr:hypothetical protein VCRA2110O182_180055 [Vibrio crassostreae]CAK2278795.1 hypothetical protein VCRA2111O408_170043 [Vibrio crassostreae]CAK2294650.1 hypothetical protein VCRA211O406_180054 [Vibrio crassostreae]CAK2531648.1 hypothetical protein VCRA2113O415_60056 [Vibrio crassostreae]CAK2958150.1 hypothetical protein VCRA2113O420_60057 [Vibrio crassostreae]
MITAQVLDTYVLSFHKFSRLPSSGLTRYIAVSDNGRFW